MPILAQLIDDVVTHKFELNQAALRIGRHSDNDIVIDDLSVSGQHAVIDLEQSPYLDNAKDVFIRDLKSTNGTFVNEQRVLERQRLSHNDIVRIGFNSFKFIDDSGTDLEKTAHILQE
jgi:pSer/pThr/pTyr-binding forkhead associated (FHA) protein